jgi:hypothetical protein
MVDILLTCAFLAMPFVIWWVVVWYGVSRFGISWCVTALRQSLRAYLLLAIPVPLVAIIAGLAVFPQELGGPLARVMYVGVAATCLIAVGIVFTLFPLLVALNRCVISSIKKDGAIPSVEATEALWWFGRTRWLQVPLTRLRGVDSKRAFEWLEVMATMRPEE